MIRYLVFVDRSSTVQLSPLNTVFSYKKCFIMLYTENIGLRDCSGFLQIESHNYLKVNIMLLNESNLQYHFQSYREVTF